MDCAGGDDTCFCVSMGSNRTDDYSLALKFSADGVQVQVTDDAFAPYFAGMAEADYITVYDEVVDDSKDLVIRDPDATWKQKTMTNFRARELQVPVFKNGELVYDLPTLPEIQAYCKREVATLWPEVLRFDFPHNYYVDLSDRLLGIKTEMLGAAHNS